MNALRQIADLATSGPLSDNTNCVSPDWFDIILVAVILVVAVGAVCQRALRPSTQVLIVE
jgi:hypothetical protein